MKRLIKNNVSWIGHINWEANRYYDNKLNVLNGSSQNAYLIEEEKTVLIDTVLSDYKKGFIDTLKDENLLKKIDYIIINHSEKDHSGALPDLLQEIPNTPIYCTKNAADSLESQYGKMNWNFNIVKTGDYLDIGNNKKLLFVEMDIRYLPDSMATYLTGDNILFSNHLFSQHYAIEELFDDKANQSQLKKEALKFYANTFTPYSKYINESLKLLKALNLKIDMIAPIHGAIWKSNSDKIIDLYMDWSEGYKENQFTIIYDTMWEGTTRIARRMANNAKKISPSTEVKVFNVNKFSEDEIMAEVFKSKAIAVGSPTVNKDILSSIDRWLYSLKKLGFKDKKAAAFGCFGWSGEGTDIIKEKLENSGFEVVDDSIKVNWNPDKGDFPKAKELIEALLFDSEIESKECA